MNEHAKERALAVMVNALEMVEAVREEMDDRGIDDAQNCYLFMPLIMQATNTRVVVESGPDVQACNVIASAALNTGGRPKMTHTEAIMAAADILSAQALGLYRDSFNVHAGKWTNRDDKKAHDRLVRIVETLSQGGGYEL